MPPVSCSTLPFRMRETQADWSAPTGTIQLNNTSIILRPGAVAQDYLTAFSYGPIELGNITSGSIYRPWRIRAVSGTISSSLYISAGQSGSFSTESGLFSFTNSPSGTVREVDLAFDTSGRAAVALERSNLGASSGSLISSSVWLYWFNPFASSFVLQEFATASITPRVILDNFDPSGSSDLLLFYLKKPQDTLVYRQQRDQYAIEYNVPLPPSLIFPSASAVTGTIFDTKFTGSFTGSSGASGTVGSDAAPAKFTGSVWGYVSGTFIGKGTASINPPEQFNGSWIGFVNGVLTGSFTGTLVSVVTGTLSGTLFGELSGSMTGTMTGSATGAILRARSGSFSNSFVLGYVTGSVDGTVVGVLGNSGSISLRGSGSFDGTISGSISGSNVYAEFFGGYIGTPTGTWKETYLEDAVKLTDSRVCVFYSRRDPITDIWVVKRFESILYQQSVDVDRLSTSASIVTQSLRTFISNYYHTGTNVNDVVSFQSLPTILTTSIVNSLIAYYHTGTNVNDVVSFQSLPTILTTSLAEIVLTHLIYDKDTLFSGSISLVTSSLNIIVIDHSVYDKDTLYSSSISFISGSLEGV